MNTNDNFSPYAYKRQQMVAPIKQYMNTHADKKTCLLLDGTGPRLTIQLPYLSGLSDGTLDNFHEIHAFSGGIAAYCIYLAQIHHGLKHEPNHLMDIADKKVRSAHKQPWMQYSELIKNYLRKEPLYSDLHYMSLFDYIFNQNFLQTPLDDIAPNFIPYVALPNRLRPVPINSDNGFDRKTLTLYDTLAMGMRIPHLYRAPNKKVTHPHPLAFDAVYAQGYWAMRNRLSDAMPAAVILTLLPKGLADHACTIDVLKGKNIKPQLMFDMITFILNIPNKRYRKDLNLAYL